MELILGLGVGIAVSLFGALISLGNERQRQAIDELRKQIVLWAIQDLNLKREKLALDVQVHDPVAWLNRVAKKACGESLDLVVTEFFDNPQVLVCTGKEQVHVLVSPASPEDAKRIRTTRRHKLSGLEKAHPLRKLPVNVEIFDVSILTSGVVFDLELSMAWEALTGRDADQVHRLWLYVFPNE